MDSAFGFFAFCMMIYISTAMVTKKDLRRMLGTQRDGRAPALRSMLAERKGSICTLILTGSALTFPGLRATGVLRDLDDEWVLLECPQKKGPAQLKAVRIDLVSGIEE